MANFSVLAMDTPCLVSYDIKKKYFFGVGDGESIVYPGVVNALIYMIGTKDMSARIHGHTPEGSYPMVLSYEYDENQRHVIYMTRDKILGKNFHEKGRRFKWTKLLLENDAFMDAGVIAAYLYALQNDGKVSPTELFVLMGRLPAEELADITEGTDTHTALLNTAAAFSHALYLGIMGEEYPVVSPNGMMEDIPADIASQFDTGKIPEMIQVEEIPSAGGSGTTMDYDLHVKLDSTYSVPEIGKEIVLSKETREIAATVKQLENETASVPMNFLMLGEPGSGKTTAARNVAGLLKIPYAALTCSANMDEDSLFGTLLPVTDDVAEKKETSGDIKKILSEITEEDLTFEPEMVAAKIGAKGSTLKDILSAVLEAGSNDSGSSDMEYHYVPSPVVEIYEHGGVLELQEPASVKDVSVLTALYNVLEPGSSMTTPTGRRINRHPNCVVIITSNHEKRELSDAFVSRMFDSYRVDLPDRATMIKRVEKKTGFKDRKSLKLMADVIEELHEYRKVNAYSGGSCGMREFENWARKCKIAIVAGANLDIDLLKKLGETAVLNKTSQSDEDLEEIRTAIWDTKF